MVVLANFSIPEKLSTLADPLRARPFFILKNGVPERNRLPVLAHSLLEDFRTACLEYEAPFTVLVK